LNFLFESLSEEIRLESALSLRLLKLNLLSRFVPSSVILLHVFIKLVKNFLRLISWGAEILETIVNFWLETAVYRFVDFLFVLHTLDLLLLSFRKIYHFHCSIARLRNARLISSIYA